MAITMAEILTAVQLLRAGRALLKGDKIEDNVAVRPVAGGPLEGADGQKVIEQLKQEHPGVAFTWLAKPAKNENSESGDVKPEGKPELGAGKPEEKPVEKPEEKPEGKPGKGKK